MVTSSKQIQPKNCLQKLSFWPFRLLFPFFFPFSAFISFHFGLLGFHLLSFWPFGLSFPFILAFWAFISVHFGFLELHYGLLRLHFLLFWPFGVSFPFKLVFWSFISFHFCLLSLHFGLFGLHFLHFGLLGLHFLSFWPFGASLWPFGVHFLLFSPFGASFPFIFAFGPSFWPFLASSFTFWLCGPSFPFILALWAFISFHFGQKARLAQICHPSLSKMVTSSKQIQPKNCLQKLSFLPFRLISKWRLRGLWPCTLPEASYHDRTWEKTGSAGCNRKLFFHAYVAQSKLASYSNADRNPTHACYNRQSKTLDQAIQRWGIEIWQRWTCEVLQKSKWRLHLKPHKA